MDDFERNGYPGSYIWLGRGAIYGRLPAAAYNSKPVFAAAFLPPAAAPCGCRH